MFLEIWFFLDVLYASFLIFWQLSLFNWRPIVHLSIRYNITAAISMRNSTRKTCRTLSTEKGPATGLWWVKLIWADLKTLWLPMCYSLIAQQCSWYSSGSDSKRSRELRHLTSCRDNECKSLNKILFEIIPLNKSIR